MSYLVIELSARKTNMLQCLGVLAPAPVLPAVMLTHALDLRLRASSDHSVLGVRGVGLVHRHGVPWIEYFDTQGGYIESKIVHRRAGCMFDTDDIVASKKKGTPAGPQQNSMQPQALADIEWALLLDCEQHVSSDFARRVQDVLQSMRLGGGVIESAFVKVFEAWSDALKHALRVGYWIEDVTADIRASASQSDPMLAILAAISDRQFGWIVPVNLGYALLEAPKNRRGARDGRHHAFAEHMIGAIRFVPASLARQHDLKPTNLWRYGWDGDQFVVTNRSSAVLSPSASF